MLLIKNGTVHTMCSESTIQADILIKEKKIAEIGPNLSCDDKSGQIINARGLHVYPGFIDAHSHIGISEEKVGTDGDDCNESTNPVTPSLRAIDAINPMDSAFHNAISAGITAVLTGPGSSNPIGGQFACIKTDGRRIDVMLMKEPAAMKVAFGENPKKTYGTNGDMPVTRMGTAYLIRHELLKARDYYNMKLSAGKDGGFSIDYNYESYLPLFSKEMPLKAHVHRLDDIFTAIRIAQEFKLNLTLDHCTEGHLAADMIASSGYPAIVGPSLSSRNKQEIENEDFKTAGILHKAGVRVAITTDHPVSRIQYLPLCAGIAAKEGLGKYQALRAITIDAAIIAQAADRVGSLEVGKDADMALFEGDPLEISGTALCTIVSGKITMNKLD